MNAHLVHFSSLAWRRFSVVFAAVLMICACSSSQSDEMIGGQDGNAHSGSNYTEENDAFEAGYKGRLDFEGDTMRVLMLGNSFASDATLYLKDVTDSAGMDRKRFCVYTGVISGGGLAKWIETLETGVQQSYYRMAGAIKMNVTGALRDILNQPWDVCVILQNSDASYKWETFENTLQTLIDGIKNHCPNPRLKFAYMMPWTHTVQSTEKEWEGNISCAKKVAKEYGLRVLPVGTAVQNARSQGLDNGMYLTRDNWHMCSGVGKFVAACALYEGLLSSFAKRSILDNTLIYTLTADEAGSKGAMAVDSTNVDICRKAAYWAAEKPFEITVEATNIRNIH